MSISNFIPVIWSEQIHQSLDEQYIAVAHCNRDFESEVKSKGGNKIKICGVGTINVHPFNPDGDLEAPQYVDDTCVELSIDQMKYFNFMINDIDLAQTSPRLIEHTTRVAASSLAKDADKYVFELCKNATHKMSCLDLSTENLINTIIAARQKLYESNVAEGSNVVLEVSPAVASEILKAKLSLPFGNPDIVETGYIGSFAGCKIYVSNNIATTEDNIHSCVMRTTRAIAFAEQVSEIIAYRPENRFADAIKGLHAYGAKVIYPDEIVSLDFKVAAPTA